MATRDLRSYFTCQKSKTKKSQTSIPELVKTTGNVTAADTSTVNAKLENFSKKRKGRKGCSCYTIIPSRVKEKVGKYATQAAINRFKSKYPQYTF